MNRLLELSNINEAKLKSYIIHRVSYELSNLTEICYYPKLKKDQYELLNMCGLTEAKLKKFIKDFYFDIPAANWKVVNVPMANLIIFTMSYFINKNDFTSFYYSMIYFNVYMYTNLINKQITFCNPGAFKYALEHISKNHLFSREKTIPNALVFLSKEGQRRNVELIKRGNPEDIAKFIQEIRTRISQSIKSFAEIYYMASEKGISYKNVEEPPIDEEEAEKVPLVQTQTRSDIRMAEDIAKNICVYKTFDARLMSEAQKLSGISPAIATIFSQELIEIGYLDILKTINLLYIKTIVEDRKLICVQKEYEKHIKYLISIKRSKSTIYFKQQISILFEMMTRNLKQENNFSREATYKINLFLSFYITLFIKKRICG